MPKVKTVFYLNKLLKIEDVVPKKMGLSYLAIDWVSAEFQYSL